MFGTGLQFSTHELIDLRFGFILPKTKCRLIVVAIYDLALTAARCIDAVKNSAKKRRITMKQRLELPLCSIYHLYGLAF